MNKIKVSVIKALDSDATLAEKHEAFDEIVHAFQDMAYACAYSVLGDFHLAQDAAQEAFISAWQKLSQLRQPEAFPGWFRRIVLTECNRLTRGKRLRTVSLDDVDLPPPPNKLQAMIEREELKNAAFVAIEQLPDNERVIIALFYLKEHSQHDISQFLEIPMTTVAKRLYSARARLRGTLTKDFKEDLMAHRPSRSKTFAEKVAAGIFDEYVGEYRYESRPEITVVIWREGNKLMGEAAGQRNELFAQNDSEHELVTKHFDGRGEFARDDTGRVTHFIYYEFGQEMGRAIRIN